MLPVSPLFFERYELKYLIPESLILPISQYVETYCVLDHYSEISHDKFYEVNNLYLDSPNFLFFQKKEAGVDNRFNMRVRSYGTEPVFPYFLEIKFKSKGFVKKKRAKVYDDQWIDEIKYGLRDEKTENVISTDYKDLFINLVNTFNAEPKIFTQYRRKAYLSLYDDYARVTFDRDLRFMRQTDYLFKPQESLMTHYDHSHSFRDDLCNNIILELKCPSNVPLWFVDMIQYFNLERTSFSKYGTGIVEVMPDLYSFKHDRISSWI
jgi:hypothetical protein